MVERAEKGQKVAVFGAGPMGREVMTQMQGLSRDPVVVDDDEAALEIARGKGFDTLNVDYRDDDQLGVVGIGRDVGILFALFSQDSKNVFLTISARALDPELHIVALSQSQESAQMLLAAGASKVIDPYEISGKKIYELIQRPLIAETLEHIVFGQQDLELAEVTIGEGAFLDGRVLGGLDISHKYNLILLGIVDRERGNAFAIVAGREDYHLDAGDVLVVIGPAEAIAAFEKDALAG